MPMPDRPAPPPGPGSARLTRFEKVGLALFTLLVVGFGAVTVVRSALLHDRHTDFNVYAHAGWAVWNGADVYRVATHANTHFIYPSAFAVAMVPFADPPVGAAPVGYFFPFAVSVALWFLLSVGFAAATVHLFAAAVLPDAARGSRRWWYARTVPFYACIGGIGFTLGRGQVNLLVVVLIAAMFAAAVRGRRVRAGAWLAAAVVVKIIPAFLFLFPAVRRDWRAGVGVAAGLVVGLVAIPVALWGPAETVAQHVYVVRHVLLAGATGGDDQPLAKELTHTTATSSQSFQSALHHLQYIDRPHRLRPAQASREIRVIHWAAAVFVTLATAWVGWRRVGGGAADPLVFLGCLCTAMMLVTPVSHMHYYAFVLPLASGLWLRSMAGRPGAVAGDRRTALVLAAWGVAVAVPLFPWEFFARLRDGGFGTLATTGLWAFGLWTIARRPVAVAAEPAATPLRTAA